MADITMLRKELVIGYVVAGFLAVLVPMDVWNDVFLRGHGFWTTLENVVVGPFIAFISFVCSIGNVPDGRGAVAGRDQLRRRDQLHLRRPHRACPLVLIYRKYYGTKLALKLFFTFWAVMSAAGLDRRRASSTASAASRKRRRGDVVHTTSSGTTRRS